jgi:hypothetical protein
VAIKPLNSPLRNVSSTTSPISDLTLQVENQTRTYTHGYKLIPGPAPYRVFTHGHVGKMCLITYLYGDNSFVAHIFFIGKGCRGNFYNKFY